MDVEAVLIKCTAIIVKACKLCRRPMSTEQWMNHNSEISIIKEF